MNKDRRNRIELVMVQLGQLKEEIEGLRQEEEDAFDNLPENLQDSEKGEAMQESASNLENAHDAVSEAIEFLSMAKEQL